MADWYLAFNHPDTLALETCERLLATFVGGPVTLQVGELDGNPRDYYTRPITITGQRGEVRLVLTASQAMGGITDAAVETLARSQRLPRLAEISRSIEHHVYASDASDQTEVIDIRRDDGRIVKSVIGHFLWP